MANANDFDDGFSLVVEEQPPVFTAAEPEAGLRRLELLYIAISGRKIATDTMKNLQGSLTVNSAKFWAGIDRPDYE